MKRFLEKILFGVLICVVEITGSAFRAQAEEKAAFYVQTAEMQTDGTIRIAVYLTNASNLGGVDAEFVYDPEKVTYVNSGLGQNFSDGYGETNCVEDESIVKCVAVFSEAKNAQGELMYAIFKLNDVESYQPEFRVVDVLDASVDMKLIPYTITYQQYDGNWADTVDTSEKLAEESVVSQAKKEYAAKEDLEYKEETQEKAVVEKSAEKSDIKEDSAEKDNLNKAQKEQNVEEMKQESKDRIWIIVGAIAFIAVAVIVIWCVRKGRMKHELQ